MKKSLNRNFPMLATMLLIALSIILTARVRAESVTYALRFFGSSPSPSSGTFTYDTTEGVFTDFSVVWNNTTINISTANFPVTQGDGPPFSAPQFFDALMNGGQFNGLELVPQWAVYPPNPPGGLFTSSFIIRLFTENSEGGLVGGAFTDSGTPTIHNSGIFSVVTGNLNVDIQPVNVTRGSSSVGAGDPLTVSWQIRNNGPDAATTSNSQVRITSSNAPNGYGNGSNNVGDPLATGSIEAGESINQSTTIAAPTIPGTYYVWIVADNNIPALLDQTNVINDFAVSTGFTVLEQTSTIPGPLTLSNQAPYWDSNPPAGPAVRLNWTKSNGAESYDVYRNDSLYRENIPSLSYLNNLNLIEGGNYSYFIIAKNSHGTRQSNVIQVGMPSSPLSIPPTLASVRISGPSQIAPGTSANYRCFAVYSNGEESEVTTSAQWGIAGTAPPSAAMAGGTLQVGPSATGGLVKVSASFQTSLDQQKRTAQKSIAVTEGFSLSITSTIQTFEDNYYLINLVANSTGGTEPFDFSWDTNDDGTYGDLVDQYTLWPLISTGGTYRIKVRATDSMNRIAEATHSFSIDKTEVPDQPEKLSPATDTSGGTFLDKDGDPFEFVTERIENGLIVITHGLNDRGDSDWCQEMAREIEARLIRENKPVPNILIYDWREASNPNRIDMGAVIRAGGALQSTAIKISLKTLLLAGIGEFATDAIGIRPIAQAYGDILGSKLYEEAGAIPPRVTASAPIHIIGHSAGGFVGGQSALVLKRHDIPVDRVTMLDTPAPISHHLTTYPDPGTIERIISSIFGTLEWPGNSDIEPNSHYTYKLLETYWNPLFGAHSFSHEWYVNASVIGQDASGFHDSPFLHGPVVNRAQNASVRMQARNGPSFHSPVVFHNHLSTTAQVDGFSSFGQVTESTGVYSITEEADAGIYKNIAVPHGVEKLRFKYKFSGTGTGDFLTVRFGARPEIYFGIDLPISREDYLEAEVELGEFADLTDNLIFTLVSRGSSGSTLEIKDIEVTESDDPDGDGLSVTEEISAGTSSQTQDSDGDGWSDSYEVNLSHTDPTRADTDGDGRSDPDEVFVGTNPSDSSSSFAIRETIRNLDGSIVLRWSGQAGKSYRIMMSATPTFDEFETIASKLPGEDPVTTYTIPSDITSGIKAAFFRIGVE